MNDEDAAKFRRRLDDAAYIQRLKSGDEHALDELTEWLYQRLPRHIERKFKQSPADAEDLASIVVRHVRDRLDRFREIAHEGAFEDWVYKVVYNKVLDELDKRKRADNKEQRELYELEIRLRDFINKNLPRHEEVILGILGSEGQEEEAPPEKIGFLRRFLTLSESDRSILILRDVVGYEYEDIARDELAAEGKPVMEKALGRKLTALYKRYERAKERSERLKQTTTS